MARRARHFQLALSSSFPAANPADYIPGPLRSSLDHERGLATEFCARHPEFSKLPHDALMQAASLYRDMADHALRADLPMGTEHYRRQEREDVSPPWSDEMGFGSLSFCACLLGGFLLGLGLFAPRGLDSIFVFPSLIAGAFLMGIGFELGAEGR